MYVKKRLSLSITGGTDVPFSQPYDYFANVFVAQLRRFCDIECSLIKRGYYPKGGGYVKVVFKGNTEFKPLELTDQGYLMHLRGVSHASADLQKARVAERQASAASLILKRLGNVHIRHEYGNTLSTGSGITVWAIYSKDRDDIDFRKPIRLGADCLGERGKKAEMVGQQAAERLIKQINSKAPFDKYLADQILPFLAVSGGTIKVAEITEHCKTNMNTIAQFLGTEFQIKDNLIRTKPKKPV
jgi:RNA 3'-terminal phosphate cyclase (GTP)